MIKLEYYITIEKVPTVPTLADNTVGVEYLSFSSDPNDKKSYNVIKYVEVSNILDSLTNTARIEMPMLFAMKRGGVDQAHYIAGSGGTIFQRGQKVVIQCGYDYLKGNGPELKTIFTGYIVNVIPSQTIVLECEDAMFKLKQCVSKSYSVSGATPVKLKDLLTGILPSWATQNMTVIDATLGGYKVIKGNSVAFELDRLNDSGFTIEFDAFGVMRAGLRYSSTDPNVVSIKEFKYEVNIISDDAMVYKRPDDVLLCVNGVSVDYKNNVIKYKRGSVDSLGNPIGQVINYKGYGLTQATLQLLVDEIYLKSLFEGFTGKFITFLQPTVYPGDAIRLLSDRMIDKRGVFLVKRVDTWFGYDGEGQEIHLDRKIADA